MYEEVNIKGRQQTKEPAPEEAEVIDLRNKTLK